jgi:hypothetical protein
MNSAQSMILYPVGMKCKARLDRSRRGQLDRSNPPGNTQPYWVNRSPLSRQESTAQLAYVVVVTTPSRPSCVGVLSFHYVVECFAYRVAAGHTSAIVRQSLLDVVDEYFETTAVLSL